MAPPPFLAWTYPGTLETTRLCFLSPSASSLAEGLNLRLGKPEALGDFDHASAIPPESAAL
jgi:hypothetical protein